MFLLFQVPVLVLIVGGCIFLTERSNVLRRKIFIVPQKIKDVFKISTVSMYKYISAYISQRWVFY
jgi:hypothetical protein